MRLCDHFAVIYFTNFRLQIYSNFYYINNTLWSFYSQISFVFKFSENFSRYLFLFGGSTTAPHCEASQRASGWTTSCSAPASVSLDLRSCRLPPPGPRRTTTSRLRPAPGEAQLRNAFFTEKKEKHPGRLESPMCSSVLTPRFNQSAENVN